MILLPLKLKLPPMSFLIILKYFLFYLYKYQIMVYIIIHSIKENLNNFISNLKPTINFLMINYHMYPLLPKLNKLSYKIDLKSLYHLNLNYLKNQKQIINYIIISHLLTIQYDPCLLYYHKEHYLLNSYIFLNYLHNICAISITLNHL